MEYKDKKYLYQYFYRYDTDKGIYNDYKLLLQKKENSKDSEIDWDIEEYKILKRLPKDIPKSTLKRVFGVTKFQRINEIRINDNETKELSIKFRKRKLFENFISSKNTEEVLYIKTASSLYDEYTSHCKRLLNDNIFTFSAFSNNIGLISL